MIGMITYISASRNSTVSEIRGTLICRDLLAKVLLTTALKAAILEAAIVRLRPILMTSLTTWLALLPMAIGFGGSEANAPLARAIIGGVLGATLLSLLVVPCLYVIFKRQPKEKMV